MTKKEVITRADGACISIGGCKPNTLIDGVPTYCNSDGNLPCQTDLRPVMPSIDDLEQCPRCTANAVAALYSYMLNVTTGENFKACCRFIHFNTVAMLGNSADDNSVDIPSTLQSVKIYGVCSVNAMKSHSSYEPFARVCPPQAAYDEALYHRAKGFEYVPLDLLMWKYALAEGNPILFGLKVYRSFDSQRIRGLVPIPSALEIETKEYGWHTMLCVGYSDIDSVFIVRNSWGNTWGDHGYCYIPYEYVVSPELNVSCGGWIMTMERRVDSRFAALYWGCSDKSVVNMPLTPFSNTDNDTWQRILCEFGEYDLPYRIGVLYRSVASLESSSIDTAAEKFQHILEYLGITLTAKGVLQNSASMCNDRMFVEATVDMLGRYLPSIAKFAIKTDLREIASKCGCAVPNEWLIDYVYNVWNESEKYVVTGI